MDVLLAVVFGVVQGLTEFLPISSSGHLVILHGFIGGASAEDLAFDAVLHFATALAVAVYFRAEIMRLVWTFFAWLVRRETDARERMLVFGIIIATIPAVVLGVALESFIEDVFRAATVVIGALVVGSFVMAGAEYVYRKRLERGDSHIPVPTWRGALAVGFFQSLALIPGMSRSGMAISGGMLLGLSRVEASRFAFLLAVPLLLGAGAKKLIDISIAGNGTFSVLELAVGAVSAFAVGILVVHYLLRFLARHTLAVFIAYRLVLAAVLAVVVLVFAA